MLATSCFGARPSLILAFGVHGSPETLAAIPETAHLIAVNPAADAPIFGRAQAGIRAAALATARALLEAAAPDPAPAAPAIGTGMERAPDGAPEKGTP